ncbi:hypothetical protein BGZ83_009443 [Gryganskiella cystojenkinii]|nr:hypothetical protein BGZ83_009443 [Gryganskiella cystojenkinii]
MSNLGFPQTGISSADYYAEAIEESDANVRRRLFADARQSNLGAYAIYVLAAGVEEKWGGDSNRLKATLQKGVIVFKNPAGNYPKVSKDQWLREASEADKRGQTLTAKTLRLVVAENL